MCAMQVATEVARAMNNAVNNNALAQKVIDCARKAREYAGPAAPRIWRD